MLLHQTVHQNVLLAWLMQDAFLNPDLWACDWGPADHDCNVRLLARLLFLCQWTSYADIATVTNAWFVCWILPTKLQSVPFCLQTHCLDTDDVKRQILPAVFPDAWSPACKTNVLVTHAAHANAAWQGHLFHEWQVCGKNGSALVLLHGVISGPVIKLFSQIIHPAFIFTNEFLR